MLVHVTLHPATGASSEPRAGYLSFPEASGVTVRDLLDHESVSKVFGAETGAELRALRGMELLAPGDQLHDRDSIFVHQIPAAPSVTLDDSEKKRIADTVDELERARLSQSRTLPAAERTDERVAHAMSPRSPSCRRSWATLNDEYRTQAIALAARRHRGQRRGPPAPSSPGAHDCVSSRQPLLYDRAKVSEAEMEAALAPPSCWPLPLPPASLLFAAEQPTNRAYDAVRLPTRATATLSPPRASPLPSRHPHPRPGALSERTRGVRVLGDPWARARGSVAAD